MNRFRYFGKLFFLSIFVILSSCGSTDGEGSEKVILQKVEQQSSDHDKVQVFTGGPAYETKVDLPTPLELSKVKNIILLIGDGTGPAQVYSGKTANKGNIFLDNFPVIGKSKTNSSDDYVTDSAAGATALSVGEKTYNGAIGVGPNGNPLKTILEMSEEKGLSTGLVATSTITHATPASFIAHQPQRKMHEEIAADFLKTDIDLFLGGGLKFFTDRKDGRDLTQELKSKGYSVLTDVNQLKGYSGYKLAGLFAEDEMPKYPERKEFLPEATKKAIDILSKNDKGFFLMVEGSQIDWGGHNNDLAYVINEFGDFDRAVGVALEFAANNKETLVIVTADHETGGLSLISGDINKGRVEASFATGHHTAVPVQVYAYGPYQSLFQGTYENTAIFSKMKEAFGF
ncbi:alkaline phosphatase [Marinigracilibium pacificum]|uniref:Alkaline phosphatase n=1 Tax=Marinigracilibium pacificum TaxID=2729599 RepID=A0A848IZY7_9BACT|nr:alkaline phosphatase [Marinigracilibium pacificum]NMM50103.1 alkaline phosphatase [Marinigracilibium pacificum]